MVSEVEPRPANKGSVIHAFMCVAPLWGRVLIFIDDDVTEEDGFDAVSALEGLTIRVDEGPKMGARYRISDVDQVIEWLESWPSRFRSRHR